MIRGMSDLNGLTTGLCLRIHAQNHSTVGDILFPVYVVSGHFFLSRLKIESFIFID